MTTVAYTPDYVADNITSNSTEAILIRSVLTSRLKNYKTTAREWFTQHDGQRIHTVQCQGHDVWMPLNRLVSTDHATYVTLDGSRRDYAGLRVIDFDADALHVSYMFGDTECWAYYIVAQ